MQTRRLGRSGLEVCPLALGTFHFGGRTDPDEARKMIRLAETSGLNLIDTADSYHQGQSEETVGKILKEEGIRSRFIVATKVYNRTGDQINDYNLSRRHIISACEASLRRLQTDYIDLYQLHRPSQTVPQEEIIRTLDDLVSSGKVRYVGTSTFPSWMIMEGLAISEHSHRISYISEQCPYNLLDRRVENELIPLTQKYDLAVLPWAPLGMGILAGRYIGENGKIPEFSRRAETDWKDVMKDRMAPKALEVAFQCALRAQKRGIKPAQMALLWCKDQSGVTAPIIGPRTVDQLEELLDVLEMTLTEEDRSFFDGIVHPGNAVSDFYSSAWWMKGRVQHTLG